MSTEFECTHSMEQIMTPYGLSSHCKNCKGSMFNLASFKNNVVPTYTKDLWKLANEGSISENKCPQCGLNMKKAIKCTENSQVEFHVCKSCQAIWFTEDNFSKAPIVFPIATKQNSDALSQDVKKKIATVMVRAENEARAQDFSTDFELRHLGTFLGPVEANKTQHEKPPYMTWGIIAITSIISLFVLFSGLTEEIFLAFGFLPSQGFRYLGLTMITSFFLHGGILHLVSNMYFLWVFGDNVENRLGSILYIVILFFSAAFGNLIHAIFAPDADIICIGASGGISGVLIFYCLMFPSRLLLLRFGRFVYPVPSIVFGLFWFGSQLLGAYSQIAGRGSVSYLAHVGGAVIGIIMWAFLHNDPEYKKAEDAL